MKKEQHLKAKHTGEEQKDMLFTPLSQDDFLPGNYGADHLNEIIWLIIENMNDKKNNSQQAEEWEKQEPWISIAGILYDVEAGAMFRFSALKEIKEYVDKLLLQARADERREMVEIIKKLQRRPETALETADEVGAYNHGLGLIINLIKEK